MNRNFSRIAKELKTAMISRSYSCLKLHPQSISRVYSSKISCYPKSLPRVTTRYFATYPSHKVVTMPSLSPTMETGSISKWNIKEGDKFEPGTSFCDVETDKATVSFDATDEGYLAKILVGSGEVKLGQPIMIVVEEQTDISAFKSFSLDQVSPSTSAKVSQAPSSPPPSLDTNQASAPPVSSTAQKQSLTIKTDRVFASPLAKKLVREANQNLAEISTALDSRGSGPNNRLVASDVRKALDILSSRPAPSAQKVSQATVQSQERILSPPVSSFPTSPYSDFELTPSAQELGSRLAATKQTVPHYYVSVEINLKDLLGLRDKLLQQFAAQKKSKDSENNSLSVLDFLVKAAALAVHQVPDVNASWMETFVRRYEQVDINLVMGSGSSLAAPVLRDVSSRGLSSISEEISRFENSLFSADASSFLSDGTKMAPGTLSIHNLGGYGVKSAAPIILPNQACALAFGSIVETVIPSKQEGKEWEVAPIMIATLSCDHRVVDGAVSAQYLAAFKQLVESPMNLLL